MHKPLKPTDGRLKANRDWSRFMMRAVHIPSMQRAKGEFHVEPVDMPNEEVLRPATSAYDGTADRLLLLTVYNCLGKLDHGYRTIMFAREIAAELYWRCIDSQQAGDDPVKQARAQFAETWWRSLDVDDRHTLARAYTKRYG
jgi:hypothetical protein